MVHGRTVSGKNRGVSETSFLCTVPNNCFINYLISYHSYDGCYCYHPLLKIQRISRGDSKHQKLISRAGPSHKQLSETGHDISVFGKIEAYL